MEYESEEAAFPIQSDQEQEDQIAFPSVTLT